MVWKQKILSICQKLRLGVSVPVSWVKVQNFKILNLKIKVLKLVECQQNINNFKLNGQLSLDNLKTSQRNYYNLPNSAFLGLLSMESQPQNPEFRNSPMQYPIIRINHLDDFIMTSHFC